ncbi:hypothetical protein [Niallia taxi]|uniref:hypothetical protein n=1 Tax=Niallia taxi TaxID=2499688 RepID=UPI0015F70E90|nr:hypothetical protein [Niallia taxi]
MGEFLFGLLERFGIGWVLFMIFIGIPVSIAFIGWFFQEIEASKARRRMNTQHKSQSKKKTVTPAESQSPLKAVVPQEQPKRGPAVSPFATASRKTNENSTPSSPKVVQFQRKTK